MGCSVSTLLWRSVCFRNWQIVGEVAWHKLVWWELSWQCLISHRKYQLEAGNGEWAKWEATDTPRSDMQGLPSRSERVLCLVAQACWALCDPVDCSPPGFSVHGNSPGKNSGVGCHALLHGIFPTQGSNTGLLHCRQILHHLRHRVEFKSQSCWWMLAYRLLKKYLYIWLCWVLLVAMGSSLLYAGFLAVAYGI